MKTHYSIQAPDGTCSKKYHFYIMTLKCVLNRDLHDMVTKLLYSKQNWEDSLVQRNAFEVEKDIDKQEQVQRKATRMVASPEMKDCKT